MSEVDIVIENFCLGLFEKFGFGYDVLLVDNLGFVMVCLFGYG